MAGFSRRAPILLTRPTDIGLILRSDREAMNITAFDLDQIIGTQDGYIQKCENAGRFNANPHQSRNPIRVNEVGFCWMEALGRSMVMMDTADALRLSELLPTEEVGGRRYERVKMFAFA